MSEGYNTQRGTPATVPATPATSPAKPATAQATPPSVFRTARDTPSLKKRSRAQVERDDAEARADVDGDVDMDWCGAGPDGDGDEGAVVPGAGPGAGAPRRMRPLRRGVRRENTPVDPFVLMSQATHVVLASPRAACVVEMRDAAALDPSEGGHRADA